MKKTSNERHIILENEKHKIWFIQVKNGWRAWSVNGEIIMGFFHRTDGPSVIYKLTGEKKYYLDDRLLTFDRWFETLTREEKIEAIYNPENF